MSLIQKSVNFKTDYFGRDNFTPINGTPDYLSIKKLENEVLEALALVPTSLGGGLHGHLGLCVDAETYKHYSTTPFTRPTDPGTFTTPTTGIVDTRKEHDRKNQAYLEVNQLESTVLQMIKQALDPKITKLA